MAHRALLLLQQLLLLLLLVRSVSSGGPSALHRAAQSGDEAATRRLLRRGADANGRSSAGVLPLHVAAQEGRLGVVARRPWQEHEARRRVDRAPRRLLRQPPAGHQRVLFQQGQLRNRREGQGLR